MIRTYGVWLENTESFGGNGTRNRTISFGLCSGISYMIGRKVLWKWLTKKKCILFGVCSYGLFLDITWALKTVEFKPCPTAVYEIVRYPNPLENNKGLQNA